MSTLKLDIAQLASDAAWIAKQAVIRRTYVPALASVMVSVTEDGLRLRRTDFDLFAETVTAAHVSTGGEDVAVLVDPKRLADALKGAKGEAVVTVTSSGLEIVIGARTLSVAASSADLGDFPSWPANVHYGESVGLEPWQLKAVLASVGTDDTLPMLTGVRFDGQDVATTDRFRLTMLEHTGDIFTGVLVPQRALRAFTVGKGAVTVEHGNVFGHVNQRYVRVSRGGRSVTAVPLDAEFPKYRQLIPSDSPIVVEFNRAELLAAVSDGVTELELFGDGIATVKTYEHHNQHPDGIVSRQTIAATDIAGDVLLVMRFNSGYLRDVLRNLPGEVVRFRASTANRPAVWESPSDDSVLHLLMPVRIPG